MRKYIRNMLRVRAERMGAKPSKHVAEEYDRYAVARYGETRRRINQAKGTHKRKTWKNRIADVV